MEKKQENQGSSGDRFGDATGRIRSFAILTTRNPLGYDTKDEEAFRKKFLLWTKDTSKKNKAFLSEATKDTLLSKIKETGDTCLQYGCFDDKFLDEKTLLVFNIGCCDAQAVAGAYGQESFFFGETGLTDGVPQTKMTYWRSENACQSYRQVAVAEALVTEKETEAFLSQGGISLKTCLSELADSVMPVENEVAFQESLDEERPFLSRASHRKDAYRKA